MTDILKNVRECVNSHRRDPEAPYTAIEQTLAERVLTLEVQRDELIELARDIVCVRTEHLNRLRYYAEMESVARKAYWLLAKHKKETT